MGEVVVPELLKSVLHPEYFCQRVAGFCRNPYKVLHENDFISRVLKDKPAQIAQDNYIDNLYEEIKTDPEPRETVKVLHVSDIHIDFEYHIGKNANCGKPICCRIEDGPPATPADAAPRFGHPNCDAPVEVAETAFEYLASLDESEKPDLIVWTGDNTPHEVWQ